MPQLVSCFFLIYLKGPEFQTRGAQHFQSPDARRTQDACPNRSHFSKHQSLPKNLGFTEV